MSFRESLMVDEPLGRLDARGADVYGTMLAIAEVLLYDDPEEREGDAWTWCDDVRAMVLSGEQPRDEDHLLAYILSSVVDAPRASQLTTIAEWIHRAAGRVPGYEDTRGANRVLGTYGLKVLAEYAPAPGGEPLGAGEGAPPTRWLAIANQYRGLAQLLQGTHWGSRAGSQAVWQQAARRLAQVMGGITASRPIDIGGTSPRAVLLPLERAVPFDPHASLALLMSDHSEYGH